MQRHTALCSLGRHRLKHHLGRLSDQLTVRHSTTAGHPPTGAADAAACCIEVDTHNSLTVRTAAAAAAAAECQHAEQPAVQAVAFNWVAGPATTQAEFFRGACGCVCVVAGCGPSVDTPARHATWRAACVCCAAANTAPSDPAVVGMPTVEHALGGFNATIIACGGSHAGKTHTLVGQLPAAADGPLPAEVGAAVEAGLCQPTGGPSVAACGATMPMLACVC
jgi:hypothetical protein